MLSSSLTKFWNPMHRPLKASCSFPNVINPLAWWPRILSVLFPGCYWPHLHPGWLFYSLRSLLAFLISSRSMSQFPKTGLPVASLYCVTPALACLSTEHIELRCLPLQTESSLRTLFLVSSCKTLLLAHNKCLINNHQICKWRVMWMIITF